MNRLLWQQSAMSGLSWLAKSPVVAPDEQHVLSQHHFHPRITVIKHQQQRSAVTYHHCEDAPAPVAALMAQSATLMTAFRSISKVYWL